MADISISSSKMFEKLKAYNNDAFDCIFFKYVFEESDLAEEEEGSEKKTFQPEFTHQIFGEEEKIFGYKQLRIDYYLTPGLLDACICMRYKEKLSARKYDGIEPDDVYGQLAQFGCSPGFVRGNVDTFAKEKLSADRQFRPFGAKIHEFSAAQATYELYKVDATCAEFASPAFTAYMERLQTMLVFYIETSSFVDTDDSQWIFYLLFERRKDGRFVTAGCLTAYHYYAYPDRVRARISQVMLMPSYRAHGLGAQLVAGVYRDACADPRVLDVTAEGPSEDFVRLRDFVTARMCATLPAFQDAAILKKGFSADMAAQALTSFKIPKLQARRSYEVLRLAVTDRNEPTAWRDYRVEIKKRIYMPFIRKAKCARNAGALLANNFENMEPNGGASVEPSSSTNGAKNSAFENRLGKSAANRFGQIQEEDEDDQYGATTIGFGSGKSTAATNGTTTIGFGNAKPTAANGTSKTVVVSSKATPVVTNPQLNTSNSSADLSDQENAGGQSLNAANLFVSEKERKKYLEDEFQQTVTDYDKVLKRLEAEKVI